MHQPSLLHAEHFTQRVAYQALFQHLPVLAEPRHLGRPGVSRNALLRAFIYRALRRIRSLTDLLQALHEIPALAEAIGFDPLRPLPPLERFSAFLRTTDNGLLQAVRVELLKNLLAEKVITGRSLALDSCPIASPVRENNLKTAVRDRFNKERFPKADPTARLGVLTSYVSPPSRKYGLFLGLPQSRRRRYRNRAASLGANRASPSERRPAGDPPAGIFAGRPPVAGRGGLR